MKIMEILKNHLDNSINDNINFMLAMVSKLISNLCTATIHENYILVLYSCYLKSSAIAILFFSWVQPEDLARGKYFVRLRFSSHCCWQISVTL